MKLLSTLSLNISEEEYRDIPALDYSLISRYTNTGFNGLETLFDKIESPSLIFGSLVDCLLTAPNEVGDKFFVSELSEPSEKVKKDVEYLYNNTDKEWLKEIDVDTILNALDMVEYQGNWKDYKRVETFIDKGQNWFRFLVVSSGKKVITKEVYDKALNVIDAFKSSKATKFYFEPNVEFADVQRFYQLKFKTKLKNGIDYKGMMDLIVVDYYKKEITICDVKTTSGKEWDFVNSFIKYNYYEQCSLYFRILSNVIKNDELFKDFKIVGFKFIVANVDNPQPLVWDCDFYKAASGNLMFGKNEQIILKDPEVIGAELKHYLEDKPKVPNNINLEGENSIRKVLNEM
jgi:hypothetical protein